MGHVANPISSRVGWTVFWQNAWYSPRIDYPFIEIDASIQALLDGIFHMKSIHATGVILSHYTLVRKYKRSFLQLFIFDPFFKELHKHHTTLERYCRFRRRRRQYRRRLNKKQKIAAFNQITAPIPNIASASNHNRTFGRVDFYPYLRIYEYFSYKKPSVRYRMLYKHYKVRRRKTRNLEIKKKKSKKQKLTQVKERKRKKKYTYIRCIKLLKEGKKLNFRRYHRHKKRKHNSRNKQKKSHTKLTKKKKKGTRKKKLIKRKRRHYTQIKVMKKRQRKVFDDWEKKIPLKKLLNKTKDATIPGKYIFTRMKRLPFYSQNYVTYKRMFFNEKNKATRFLLQTKLRYLLTANKLPLPLRFLEDLDTFVASTLNKHIKIINAYPRQSKLAKENDKHQITHTSQNKELLSLKTPALQNLAVKSFAKNADFYSISTVSSLQKLLKYILQVKLIRSKTANRFYSKPFYSLSLRIKKTTSLPTTAAKFLNIEETVIKPLSLTAVPIKPNTDIKIPDAINKPDSKVKVAKRKLKKKHQKKKKRKLKKLKFKHLIQNPKLGYLNKKKYYKLSKDAKKSVDQLMLKIKNKMKKRRVYPYNYLTRQNKIGIQQLLYRRRFTFYKNFFSRLQTLLSYSSGENLLLKIVHITTSSYTARIILRYVITKLRMKYRLSEVLRPLLHFMRGTCRGFKAKCSGRFTRKQRASLFIYKFGSAPIGKYTSRLTYAFGTVPLKYGAVGIKIYLHY